MRSKNQICVASSTSCNFSCNLQINSIHNTVSTNPCIVEGLSLIPTHFQWYHKSQQSHKTLFSNELLISSGSQHTFSHFGHMHSCFALSKQGTAYALKKFECFYCKLTQNIGSKLTMVCIDPFGDYTKQRPIFRPVTAICPCNCI